MGLTQRPPPASGVLPHNAFNRHQLNTVRAQKAAKRRSLNDHIFKFEIKSQVDTKPPSWKQSACLVISQHTRTRGHTRTAAHTATPTDTHVHTCLNIIEVTLYIQFRALDVLLPVAVLTCVQDGPPAPL